MSRNVSKRPIENKESRVIEESKIIVLYCRKLNDA